MSDVTAVSGSSYTGSTVSSTTAAMGKQDFLNLLVTQLSNQDPLNPMDNQEFAAQLAQFSSLELMTNIQATLEEGLTADESLATAIQGGMATDLIGRRITALDDRVVLDGEGAELRWEAEDGLARLDVTVTNSLGVAVSTFSLTGDDLEGDSYSWNGEDAAGSSLPDGTYTITLSGADAAGAELTARSLWQGTVETVRYREGVPYLVSGGLEYSLGQVSEVAASGDAAEDDSAADEFGLNW